MLDEYPKELELRDGQNATLRILTRADEDRALMFFLTLPESDRNFLHYDITDRETLDSWFGGPNWEEVFPLMAEINGRIVGIGLLKGYRTRWSAHIGIGWVIVGESWRGLGLGRIISTELFSLATELGLEKLLAEMRSDHHDAISIFNQMGYTQEGLRTGYIKEADGRTYDLVLLGCNIQDYWRILGKKPPSQP
jgi:L-amino acid N-acyltransferase YncA